MKFEIVTTRGFFRMVLHEMYRLPTVVSAPVTPVAYGFYTLPPRHAYHYPLRTRPYPTAHALVRNTRMPNSNQ